MKVDLNVNDHFMNFLLNTDCNIYFLLGGYGSSKSYNAALKINLMSLMQDRKSLIVRSVKDTLAGSCLDDLMRTARETGLSEHIKFTTNPMRGVSQINNSEMLFRGLDDVSKIKSISNIDIIWIEECDQIKYTDFKELLKRMRGNKHKCHMFLTTNPGEMESWTYKYLVEELEKHGLTIEDLYKQREIVLENHTQLKKGNIYTERIFLHHSTYLDNAFLQDNFIANMENENDEFFRTIGTLGRFGAFGDKPLTNITHLDQKHIESRVNELWNRNTGFDFGFSNSYNAIVKTAIDEELNDLYIYSEFYINHITDVNMVNTDYVQDIMDEGEIVWGDSAEPKAIEFYQNQGMLINPAEKPKDVTKDGIRKLQTFRNIYIDKEVCPNTWHELNIIRWYKNKDNILAINPKTKKPFNIDPHTFDAIKYALTDYRPNRLSKKRYREKEDDDDGNI